MLFKVGKGVLIGLICGALLPAFLVAAFQFPSFFDDSYDALGTQVFKFGGFTFTTVTLKGGAFLYTLMAAYVGATIGAPLGLITGIVAALKSRRSP
jgi:hypothetical protein